MNVASLQEDETGGRRTGETPWSDSGHYQSHAISVGFLLPGKLLTPLLEPPRDGGIFSFPGYRFLGPPREVDLGLTVAREMSRVRSRELDREKDEGLRMDIMGL